MINIDISKIQKKIKTLNDVKKQDDILNETSIKKVKTIKIKIKNKKEIDEKNKKEKILPHGINLIPSYTLMARDKQRKEDIKESIQNKTYKKIGFLQPDSINIIGTGTVYLNWKSLDIDTKKKKIREFYNLDDDSKNLDDDMKEKLDKLFELVDTKKIYLKRDIHFDKINQRIKNIFIFDEEGENLPTISDTQKLKNSQIKKQKIKINKRSANKRNVKKMFK